MLTWGHPTGSWVLSRRFQGAQSSRFGATSVQMEFPTWEQEAVGQGVYRQK